MAPFSIATAFSDKLFGGNPAAVIFLDTSLPFEELAKIARNLNQPVLVVVSPTSLASDESENEESKIERRSIRFISRRGDLEPAVCGHGTLVATKVMFDLPEVKASKICFETTSGEHLEAIRLEEGWFEIEIPAITPVDVDDDEKKRLKGYVDEAFGRDVKVNDIKTGRNTIYHTYVIIDIDESEDLAGSVVNDRPLIDSGYVINVFTSSSSEPGYAFVSRMFAPLPYPEGEDQVCGTSHGILTPYWTRKLNLTPGNVVKARQVSKRGGDLRLIWDEERNILKLRGQCSIIAKGEINTH